MRDRLREQLSDIIDGIWATIEGLALFTIEVLAPVGIVILAVALVASACGEENVTEVIIDEPARVDTFFVYIPCPPHHFDPETQTCQKDDEHDHHHGHHHDHGHDEDEDDGG